MLSVNKQIIIGNLGRDAETRFTTNNTEITNFSVATTHSYKGKDDNWNNETTWHNITAFKVSDYVKANLIKGAPVYVEGRLSKREYTDKDGNKRLAVDLVAEKIIPLTKNESSQSSRNDIEPDKEPPSKEIELPEHSSELPF